MNQKKPPPAKSLDFLGTFWSGRSDSNILSLAPHASGRSHKSLILKASLRALAATDAPRCLTIFNDSPQKSLCLGKAANPNNTA